MFVKFAHFSPYVLLAYIIPLSVYINSILVSFVSTSSNTTVSSSSITTLSLPHQITDYTGDSISVTLNIGLF